MTLIFFGAASAGCAILDGTLFEDGEGAAGGNASTNTTSTGGAGGGGANDGGSHSGGGGASAGGNGGTGGEGGSIAPPEWMVGATQLEEEVRFLDFDLGNQQIVVAGAARRSADGTGKFALGANCSGQALGEGWTTFVAFYDLDGACLHLEMSVFSTSDLPRVAISGAPTADAAYLALTANGVASIYRFELGSLATEFPFGGAGAANDLALADDTILVAGWVDEGNDNACFPQPQAGSRRRSALLALDPVSFACEELTQDVSADGQDDELTRIATDGDSIVVSGYVGGGAGGSNASPCSDCVFTGTPKQLSANAVAGAPIADCSFPPVAVEGPARWALVAACTGAAPAQLHNLAGEGVVTFDSLLISAIKTYAITLTSNGVYGGGVADWPAPGGTAGVIVRTSIESHLPEAFRVQEGEGRKVDVRGLANLDDGVLVIGNYSGNATCEALCPANKLAIVETDGAALLSNDSMVGCKGEYCGPYIALWQPPTLDP
ncbi:MAG: hypothetical protein HOW73_04415 [Polyangiaceae bacterium]|nr:hypothetical protein [Polyangiaceae bacterium]